VSLSFSGFELTVKQVKRMHVEKRENPIVNRLNKTKTEKFPDLRDEKEARLKELGRQDRDAQQARVSVLSSIGCAFTRIAQPLHWSYTSAEPLDARSILIYETSSFELFCTAPSPLALNRLFKTSCVH
jgi:hypothetical protein